MIIKMNLSVIKSNENHCEMAQSAETNDLIGNSEWGNESSMKYFLMENQSKHAGMSVVSNATKHQDLKKVTFIIICWVLLCLIICPVKR
jgi:hypothetical protein